MVLDAFPSTSTVSTLLNKITKMDNTQINATPDSTNSDQSQVNNEHRESTVTFLEFCKLYRHELILKEFEYIKDHLIDGIYVFPSLKSLQIWYGVVFVQTGLYAEGIFQFKVILNDDYPFSTPTIRFVSKVYHPQVAANGYLNVGHSVPPQKKGQGAIWNALKYTRDCFHNIDENASCNDEVSRIMKTSTEEFKALTRGCVLESLFHYEERGVDAFPLDLETDNPFNCGLLSRQICKGLKKDLVNVEQSNETGNEEGLISWTRNTMGKVWTNLSHYSANALQLNGSLNESFSPDVSPTGTPNRKLSFTLKRGQNNTSNGRRSRTPSGTSIRGTPNGTPEEQKSGAPNGTAGATPNGHSYL